ncbi:MAG: Long-chain fatty acid transport protein [Micavibrio sp.]|nr:Long-chain fatty acid transport protein [Micavibrio sp.]
MRMTSTTAIRLGLLSATALMAITGQANAAAFALQEQSVTGLGTAYSGGAANTQDASTVFYNPAGMTNLSGTQINIGAINLSPNTKMTNNGSTGSVLGVIAGNDGGNPFDSVNLVPHAYLSHAVNDKLWVGLAVTAPYGLAEEYDQGWFGRFGSTKSQLSTIDVAPSIAYKINNQWSVGAGVDVQYVKANLEANPSTTSGGTGVVSKLNGDDISVGANFGVQWHPTEMTNLGLTYRTGIGHELEGSISSAGATPAGSTYARGHANLDLPDIVTFGASQKLDNQWTVQGQVNWYNWSRFHDITAITNTGVVAKRSLEEYDDTFGVAIGTEYKHNDTWTFRGGMQYDETPTVDSRRDTLVPDGNRTWLTGGATYNITPNVGLNFAAAYIWVTDANLNYTTPPAGALGTETIRATAESHIILTGIDLTYKF